MAKRLVILLAVALILSLAGGAAMAAKTQITFWTMSLTPQFTDYIQGMVNQYEKMHPDVDVVWQDIPWNTIQQQFLTAVASGDAPDVINMPGAWVIGMAQRGALHNMEELVDKADRAKYFEGIWVNTLWNGKTWGIPWYVAPDVLFYNADIFKKAGLDPKKPPKTWDEAIEYAGIIKKKTGMYGFEPNFLLLNILERDGIYMLSDKDQGRKVTFNTPEAVSLVAKWVKVYKDGLVPPDVATNVRAAELDAVKRFEAGQLGMLITGPQFALRVKQEAPEVYKVMEVAMLPLGKAGTVRASIQDLAIPRGSKYPKIAADFALFVTNAANQVQFSKLVTIFPSNRQAAKDPFFTRPDSTLDGRARQIGAEVLEGIDATPINMPNATDMNKVLDDAMTKALLGQMSPAEALAWAEKEWERLIAASEKK